MGKAISEALATAPTSATGLPVLDAALAKAGATADMPVVEQARRVVATFGDSLDSVVSKALATFAALPSTNAAGVIAAYGKPFNVGPSDANELAEVVDQGIAEVHGGSMRQAEAMLYGQAQALQAVFASLAMRASQQDHMKNWEAYLRMALKAQNQCRMTLETLSAIKNPPVVFAKQANINQGGQQQVNNGVESKGAPSSARAAADAITPTGLLEQSNGQRLDTGAPGAAGGADPQLAPVGEVDRAKDRRGQGSRGAQQGSRRPATGAARAGKRGAGRA